MTSRVSTVFAAGRIGVERVCAAIAAARYGHDNETACR